MKVIAIVLKYIKYISLKIILLKINKKIYSSAENDQGTAKFYVGMSSFLKFPEHKHFMLLIMLLMAYVMSGHMFLFISLIDLFFRNKLPYAQLKGFSGFLCEGHFRPYLISFLNAFKHSLKDCNHQLTLWP